MAPGREIETQTEVRNELGQQGGMGYISRHSMLPAVETLLPVFHGAKEENFNSFLNNFEDVAREFEWQENYKLIWFKARTLGEARKFLETIHQNPEDKTYQNTIQKFKEFYTTPADSYKSAKIRDITHEHEETIISLKFRIEREVRKFFQGKININSEDGKKAINTCAYSQLMEAISPKLREKVLREANEDFESAINILIKEEALGRELQSFGRQKVEFEQQPDEFIKLLQDRDGKIAELEESINALKINRRSMNRDVKVNDTRICNFCNIPGHIKPECRKFKKFLEEKESNVNHRENNLRRNRSNSNERRPRNIGNHYNNADRQHYNRSRGQRMEDNSFRSSQRENRRSSDVNDRRNRDQTPRNYNSSNYFLGRQGGR